MGREGGAGALPVCGRLTLPTVLRADVGRGWGGDRVRQQAFW